MSRGYDRGAKRERQVAEWLRGEWNVVYRSAGSHGAADLVAMRRGARPWLVQVKANAGRPYDHFGPTERGELLEDAEVAGADAWLAWWPPHGELKMIPASDWPR